MKYETNFRELSFTTSLEKQLPDLPNEIKFCKKCVVSNQRPRIIFDEEGICGACRWAEEKNQIDWKLRKEKFEKLLDKYRKNNGEFDVVVPGSGGKDSGMIAHKLKYEYGMNPLYVTWSPLLYTNIGFQNLQNLYDSGISGTVFTPDRKLQRVISLLGLVYIGNHFEAFGRGQMGYPFHVAAELDIKLVMYGENGELEYGGSIKNKDKPGQPMKDWIELYHKGSSTKEMLEQGIKDKLISKEILNSPSLKYFSAPKKEILLQKEIEFYWFGYYHKWNPQENYYYAAENYNFQTNPKGRSEGTFNKYASLDDATDPLHYYLSYIKFGLGRATSDAAHEIREGHLTREEGIQLVKKYDHEYPSDSLNTTLDYLQISKKQLDDIIEGFQERRPHLWKKTNEGFKIKKTIFDK